jgi:Flp pilus assembly protein TadD
MSERGHEAEIAMLHRKFRFLIPCVFLFAATVLAYLPAMRGGFVWDDDAHVTRPELRSLSGLREIWFRLGATQQYYPVAHSAFWLEHHFWGDATLGYHLLNVLLHALAACLFGLVLRRLSIPGAWLAAGIFALHPVCVESAAWISEQKNTVSAVLYLAAALAYLRFERIRMGRWYAVASALFALAVLAKSVTATLPAALLLVLGWRRGRLDWRRDVRPLVPWFLFAAAAGSFTAWVERRFVGAQGSDYALSLPDRCVLAGRAVMFYLGKLAWPARLTFVYPHWDIRASDPVAWLPLAAVLLVTIGLWRFRRRGVLAGWLFFIGTLFPALGFIDVYPFRYSYVADHFQYLASLGIIALAAGGLTLLGSRLAPVARRAGSLALLALLGVLTFGQCRIYADSDTLYRATIALNPTCWLAYGNLGTSYLDEGRLPEAEAMLTRAVELKPDADSHYNLANVLRAEGRVREAIPHYEEALRLRPDYAEAHDNLGAVLGGLGDLAGAADHFREAIRLDPGNPRAHYNLGIVLRGLGRLPEAIVQFRQALQLRPDYPEASRYLGMSLRESGGSPSQE